VVKLIRIFQAEAPHKEDRTLIEIPGEKALIPGDSTGGGFAGRKRMSVN